MFQTFESARTDFFGRKLRNILYFGNLMPSIFKTFFAKLSTFSGTIFVLRTFRFFGNYFCLQKLFAFSVTIFVSRTFPFISITTLLFFKLFFVCRVYFITTSILVINCLPNSLIYKTFLIHSVV